MAFEYQGFATLGVNLNRQKYGPLDIAEVFTSETDFNWYVSKGTAGTPSEYWTDIVPYPYPGMVAAVILGSDVSVRVVTSEEGDWKEVGSATLGDDKSIELNDGVLSMKNFGKKYWAYQAGEEGAPGTYVETSGWTAPLEPKVRLVSEGEYELAWYQPNPTTVEGLQSSISDLQATVSNMYQKTDVYNKTEIDGMLEWGTIE